MKNKLIKNILGTTLAAVTALQCILPVGNVVVAAEELPTYKKVTDFAACDGEQGYNGWYYMQQNGDTGKYEEMKWDGSQFVGGSGSNINTHFINPGWNTPAVLAWKAPYSGTVTLKLTDDTLYRNGPNAGHGDAVATLKLNDTIIKQNNGTEAQWTYDETCANVVGKRNNYTITGVKVKAGDMIYHIVDCGTDNYNAGLYWKPIIEYTKLETSEQPTVAPVETATPTPTEEATPTPEPTLPPAYKKVTDFAACDGEQGYNGWYYMQQNGDTGKYEEMKWDGSQFVGGSGSNINTHFINPGWNTPAVLAWKAPYSGTVTLKLTDDTLYRNGPNAGHGDAVATLKLNDTIIKQNNGTEAQWTYDETCANVVGKRNNYTITGVKVKAGDMIYHIVDCGTDNYNAGLYWKPIIEYTKLETSEQPTVAPVETATPTPTEEATPTPEPTLPPAYKKVTDFAACKGEQGYNGWYYMQQNGDTGKYEEMKWDGSQFVGGSGSNINTHFINPGWNTPAVLAWKAPYSGTVTLKLTDDTLYRNGPNAGHGDAVATLKLNDTIIKQNNGTEAQWIYDETCANTAGKRNNYTITGLHINKGDVIYHIVDCGTDNYNAGLYWKPIIAYTELDPYKLEGDGSKDNPYLIDSAEGINAVAEEVSKRNDTVFSEFTADVTASNNLKLIDTYTGVIDGNNHKLILSGYPLVEQAKGDITINNLIVGGTVRGENNVGAFIGATDTDGEDKITIENCGNVAEISASGDYAAGFVGLVNDNDSIIIKNSYSYGSVKSSRSGADPFANLDIFAYGEYEKCYYLKDGTKSNGSTTVNPQITTQKEKTAFASGEVTYLLGGIFGQKLTEPKDEYPVFKTQTNGVYRRGSIYTNTLIDTSELKFNMRTSYPKDGAQGTDGWYFMKWNGKTNEYENLTYLPDGRFGAKDNNGNVTSFISNLGQMQSNLSSCIGWKAPMAGKVRLTTRTPIFKTGKGAAVTVKIKHGTEVLWQELIPGDQVVQSNGVEHDVVLDVACGDMIYFDASATDPTNAAILWDPSVEYLQTAKFTVSDKQMSDTSEMKYRDRIECLFYDTGVLDKKALAYLALYDENGTMLKISEPCEVGNNATGSGGILSFDVDFEEESYNGWELRLMIINGDGVNVNPIVKHNLYSVK